MSHDFWLYCTITQGCALKGGHAGPCATLNIASQSGGNYISVECPSCAALRARLVKAERERDAARDAHATICAAMEAWESKASGWLAQRDAARARVEVLEAALLAIARWQVDERPGGVGEICDFADAALDKVSGGKS